MIIELIFQFAARGCIQTQGSLDNTTFTHRLDTPNTGYGALLLLFLFHPDISAKTWFLKSFKFSCDVEAIEQYWEPFDEDFDWQLPIPE